MRFFLIAVAFLALSLVAARDAEAGPTRRCSACVGANCGRPSRPVVSAHSRRGPWLLNRIRFFPGR